MTFAGIWSELWPIPSAWRDLSTTRSGRWRMPLASSRAGTLSRMQPSRVRSGGLPVLRTPICPLPTRLCRLLTRLRVWGATIPAHAAAARSSRSAAWTEGRSGPPCQACYDMRRVPHKLARLAVLRSALPRNANEEQDHATLGQTRHAPVRPQGPKDSLGLHLRGHLSG